MLKSTSQNKKYLLAASPQSEYAFENTPSKEEEGDHNPYLNEALLCKIFEIIEKHPDERVRRIFKIRYVDPEFNKLTPWQKIGKELKMSIQGCINIHNSAIKIIRKTLKENELSSRRSH